MSGADLLLVLSELAWPALMTFAWVAGEVAHRWTGLPRISVYGIVGFVAGQWPLAEAAPAASRAALLVANVAFGLALFEFGYRINVRWLRTNRWIGVTALLESAVTFAAVYAAARLLNATTLTALLLASTAMSTSPAAVIRVVNEERSSGQVTERLLHLTAVNCVLAVLAFKVVVGFWAFETSGSLVRAFSTSALVLAASSLLGAVFGIGVPALLRGIGRLTQDATVGLALAVILLVAVTHALKLSPLVAALAFGLVARHRRVALSQAQRNFGALGDLLVVVLFTYVATTIHWSRVEAGLALALVFVAVRSVAKLGVVALLARPGGTTWRKGALTGVGLMPISVFVILLLEQTRNLGIDLLDQLAPLAAVALLLEVFGPIATRWALRQAHESAQVQER